MYNYFNCCVSWDSKDVGSGLIPMIDNSLNITRRTFLKYVNREDLASLEQGLGYDTHYKKGLTMASDWSVSYYRSKLHNKTVYYFRQSAIEYVFTH